VWQLGAVELELTTKRLLLRPFEPSDVELAVEMATDPDVMEFYSGAVSEAEIVAKADNFNRRAGGGCIGVWTVLDRSTGDRLGEVFLLPLPIEAVDTEWELVDGEAIPGGEIELGYLFKPSAWGKGVATEACQRLLRFAFEETPLDEIVAVIEKENAASEHVLLKCGFVFESARRAYGIQLTSFRITRNSRVRSNSASRN
jgi:RimJ/RimL family protein N-acetyltransferase